MIQNLTENLYNTVYINMSNGNLEHLIQYNVKENSVNIPFSQVAKYYLKNHPLLKNICLKYQSRKRTPELIKAKIISVEHIEGAINFIEWKIKVSQIKLTNRIDDIIKLTEKGEELVKQIEAKITKNKLY